MHLWSKPYWLQHQAQGLVQWDGMTWEITGTTVMFNSIFCDDTLFPTKDPTMKPIDRSRK